jgi:hypothetical protein
MGGSSKKQTVGYKYYLGMHLALCHGPVDKLLAIKVAERTAWSGTVASGAVVINAPDLFGGEEREGGISGTVDFETGADTQAQNTYLASKLGVDVPNFLGVCAAVLRQVYVGMNPYLKNWAFRVTRALQGWYGGTAWYAAKAAIGAYSTLSYSSAILATNAYGADGLLEVNGELWWSSFTNTIERYDPVTGAHLGTISFTRSLYAPLVKDTIGGYVWSWNSTYSTVFRIDMATMAVTTFTGVTNPALKYDENNGTLWKISTATLSKLNKNTMAVEATVVLAVTPFDLAFDAAGNIWYTLLGSSTTLRRTTQAGVTTSWVLAEASTALAFIEYDAARNSMWVSTSGRAGKFLQFDLDTETVTTVTSDIPTGGGAFYPDLVYDGGYIYQNNPTNDKFRVVDAATGTLLFEEAVTASFAYNSAPVPYAGDVYTVCYDNLNYTTHLIKWTRVQSACPKVDMNPAHIVYQCLTDPDWGMGYPTADIDDASFTAAADTLYADSMGISLLWDRGTALEDFVKEILKHIDAVAYVDRTTGKFKLKLIRADYDAGTLLVIDPSNAERVEDYKTPALGELVNTVTIRYWDSCTGNTATVGAQDIALVQLQGGTIGATIDYPGFTSADIAARVAARDLKSLSTPLASCTVYANRAAAVLNVGDVFKLAWPELGIDNLVMRVTAMAYGDGRSSRVRIQCVQDVFGLPAAVSSGGVSEWVDPVSNAAPSPHRMVLEAPYYEVVQRLGQDEINTELASYPERGYLIVAGDRPSSDAFNANVMIDAGAGYQAGGVTNFSPYARLSADIAPAATAIPFDSGVDLDTLTPGTHFQIGNELLRFDSVSGSTITAGRGVLDTVAASHSAGAAILFWDEFGASDEVEYVNAETLNVKLLPVTGNGPLAIGAAPADAMTFNQRALRPYPPGKLQVNGSYYPAAINGDAELALTWAHRDRLLQTSGTLSDHTAASIGPEAGTTYTLRIYDDLGALVRTETGLTGTSYTYTFANEILDGGAINTVLRFELESVRGGLTSWQMHNHTVLRAGYGFNYGLFYGGA